MRPHFLRNQVYDSVLISLEMLYSANGGKLARRGPIANENSPSDIPPRSTTGSSTVQQPDIIDRLISSIAGDDDDTPALEYMFRQHACAWVRAAVEGWAQAKTHMSAAIKTSDSLQSPALLPHAARSLLLGDYALITYETARINQQTPNSNILNALSQKWVKSRNLAVESAATSNIDKNFWARSFLLWYRACVGLSDCNYNINLDNREKQEADKKEKRDTQVRFRSFFHQVSISHPDLFSPAASDLQICERVYRKASGFICSVRPILPSLRCDPLLRKVQPGGLQCQRELINSRFRSSMDSKFCKRHEQLESRFGTKPRARARFSRNDRHTARKHAPLQP